METSLMSTRECKQHLIPLNIQFSYFQAYSLLCGGLTLPQTTILVEYFCDQEKTYLQLSDTKQLSVRRYIYNIPVINKRVCVLDFRG